jgi:hypothetical protein
MFANERKFWIKQIKDMASEAFVLKPLPFFDLILSSLRIGTKNNYTLKRFIYILF